MTYPHLQRGGHHESHCDRQPSVPASLADLKVDLALRQDSPVYADIRENGGIGIPCFVLEDSTVTRNLNAILK